MVLHCGTAGQFSQPQVRHGCRPGADVPATGGKPDPGHGAAAASVRMPFSFFIITDFIRLCKRRQLREKIDYLRSSINERALSTETRGE